MALACGATTENAARTANISPRTAHRRLAEPGFQERLRKLRMEMVQRASGMLTAATLEAIKILIGLLDPSAPASARLGAARTIIEFGLKLRELTDLEGRIAALENRQEELAPPTRATVPFNGAV